MVVYVIGVVAFVSWSWLLLVLLLFTLLLLLVYVVAVVFVDLDVDFADDALDRYYSCCDWWRCCC